MTKIEFLDGLRVALSSDISAQELQENLNYYSQYIDDEMRKGRTEQSVLDELGDPWMIARTIIDAKGGAATNETVYEADNREYRGREAGQKTNIMLLNTWWKKLLLIICIVGIIMLVFSIITGIVSLLAPIVIPVLLIVMLVKMIKGRK